MALSLGDAFLNFTAGAVERNNKIRDENVALALEDFKANKDLYQKIALDRYTRDSNKYDTEVEKLDSLKSVYSQIENNNYDRKTAATMILNETVKNFASLPETTQKRMIENTANSFETKYTTTESATADGVDTKQIESGYKIVPEQIKLTAPDMKDYLQDPSFWTNLQKEIKTGTSGPLTEQVLKLLGKEDSSVGAKEVLNNLEQKDGTVIKSEANVPAYTSNNNTSVDLAMAGNIYAYGDGSASELPDSLQKAWMSYVVNDPDGNQRKEIGEIFNSLPLKDIKKAIIQYQNGEAVVRPGGTSLFSEAQDLYKGIAEDILNSIMLNGGANQGNTNYFTNKLVRKFYKDEFYNRLVKVNDNDMKGYHLISPEVMGYGMRLSDYIKPDGNAVTEQDIIALIKNNNLVGSLGQNTNAINQQIYAYLSTMKNDKVEKITTTSTETGTGTGTGTGTNANFNTVSSSVSTIKAILNTEQAKKDGVTISQILAEEKDYPYDVKAIELLVPLETPPNKFKRTGSVGKEQNPAYKAWLESGQGDMWASAIEYLKSIEPQKKMNAVQKRPNQEWTEWNLNYGSYIKEYEKFLRIK